MRAAPLLLAASLASPAWGAAARPRAEAFSAARAWLSGPAAAGAAAAADPALLRLLALEPPAAADAAAHLPLIQAIEARADGPELLAGLSRLPELPAPERASLLRRLSEARLAAGAFVEERLGRVSDMLGRGEAPADLSALEAELGAFRLYGEGPARLVDEIRGRLSEARERRTLAQAEAVARALGEAREAEGLPQAGGPGTGAPLERPSGEGPRAGEETVPRPAPSGEPAAPPQEPPQRLPDWLIRGLTAAVLVPLVGVSIHWGEGFFRILTMMVSWLSLFEFVEMTEKAGRRVSPAGTLLTGLALHFALTLGLPLAPVLAAGTGFLVLREVLRKDHDWTRAAAGLAAAVVLGMMPAYLNLIRDLPFGEAWTFLAFLSAWASDTAAYLVGRRFGRRKVAPALSPNKTWEGSLAGLGAALAAAAAFKLAVPGMMGWPAAAAAGLAMGVLGQLGGFANSMIKRALGAKDSGTLLPGHGGVLDRFDAFLFAAAALYLTAWLSS